MLSARSRSVGIWEESAIGTDRLQVDIKQKIEDNGRIQTDSKDKFKHWSRRHEELELVYVELVRFL